MKISLNNCGKKYIHNTTFKGVNFTFESGKIYALLGANGSGKSTLLRIIAGIQSLSVGEINYVFNGKTIEPSHWYQYLTFCAPAMEVVEEMTLTEFLQFHFAFKQAYNNISVKEMIDIIGLQKAADQLIASYSSGMKQRVKLAQVFFSDVPILLLDEPCSNLDLAGVELYQNLLKIYAGERLVIIASNDDREYPNAFGVLNIEDYK